MNYFRFAVIAIALGAISVPAAGQYVSSAIEFVQAVRSRDGDKVTDLLRAHPNIVDMKDEKGQTGLIAAIENGDEDFTAYLLNHGADPNIPGKGGDTPLIVAARSGFDVAVEWLIGQGGKVDTPNKMGETPLIVAVQQRQAPVVKVLLTAGADPDKTDSAAGLSARDYAKRDARSRDILRMIEAKKPKTSVPAASR